MAISILFQSPQLVIVDKPAMMLAVPARFADDPRPVLGRILEEQLAQRLWPIHRLDYEVSGLLVFALDAQTHKVFNSAFENHVIQKTYQAFTHVSAAFEMAELQSEYNWESRILRGKKRSYESPQGQPARTRARLIQKFDLGKDKIFEWRFWPLTGKPHQLRFECYKNQIPICGDTLYGSLLPLPNGIALRAIELAFSAALAGAFQIPEVIVAAPMPTASVSSPQTL